MPQQLNPNSPNPSKTTLSYFKGVQGRITVESDRGEVVWSNAVAGTTVATTRMAIFQAYELAKWLVEFVEAKRSEDPGATEPL